MGSADNAPDTNHGTELDEDLNEETHSHQMQDPSVLDDEDDPQRLWRHAPNSRYPHQHSISIAVTPSVSVEVDSEFWVSNLIFSLRVHCSSAF